MGKKQENPTIRILILGAPGVGKNCLESRFTTSTYPPLYDPSLTLNSRRYLTLSPYLPVSPTKTRPLESSHGLAPLRQSQNLESREDRRPRSASSTFSNPASEPQRQEEDRGDTAVASSRGSDGEYELCDFCQHNAQLEATYLVELANYPGLQNPRARAQEFAKGEFDAVLLVYDIGNRASFEAIQDLYSEIPLRHKRRGRKRSSPGGVRKSRSSIFGTAGQATAPGAEGKDAIVALVGNKSDFDDEYASLALGLNGERVLSEKEAVLQEADVEERSLVHPLYRESRVYDDPPLSPAKSTRSTPIVFDQVVAREMAVDVRRSVLSADNALLGIPSRPRWSSALGYTRSVRTMPLPSGRRSMGSFNIPPQAPRTQSIEKWIETGNPSVPDATEVQPENNPRAESAAASDEDQTAAARRQVSRIEGEMMARNLLLHLPFYETSAKTGENVEQVFEAIVREVLRELGHRGTLEEKLAECKQRHGAKGGQSPTKKYRKSDESQETAPPLPPPYMHGALAETVLESQGSEVGVEAPAPEDVAAEGGGEALPPASPKRRRGSMIGRFRKVFAKKTPVLVSNVA
ncbi:P-loop containing nucleoside triphosphate hydrolase protein [Thozetella sp. PMI_491]|nr:P-loop containing nucleoside triphosphate hydrolase protein [Thozetella sp. PMI_491]